MIRVMFMVMLKVRVMAILKLWLSLWSVLGI